MMITSYKHISDDVGPLSILQTGVCVKECPSDAKTQFKNGDNCKDNDKYKCTEAKASDTFDNPSNICIPVSEDALDEDEKKGYKEIKDAIFKSPAGKIFLDIQNAKTSMSIAFVTSLIWCLIYILIIRDYAKSLIWCCIILVQIGLILATAYCYFQWEKQKEEVSKIKS